MLPVRLLLLKQRRQLPGWVIALGGLPGTAAEIESVKWRHVVTWLTGVGVNIKHVRRYIDICLERGVAVVEAGSRDKDYR